MLEVSIEGGSTFTSKESSLQLKEREVFVFEDAIKIDEEDVTQNQESQEEIVEVKVR